MSEAEVLTEQNAPAETPPPPKFEKIFDTRAPFDLSDELQARVDANGVADTIEELKANGYGYVRAAGTPGFNARLRETIIRIAHDNTLRPVECYDFLDEEWLKGKPYELRVLLGREDFLNTPEGAFHHGMKILTTMNWAKS